MGRRKSRRDRGRPARLFEPGVKEKLVEATKAGTPIGLAAEFAGVSSRSFQLWMARGHDEEEAQGEGQDPKPTEAPYLELWKEIQSARSAAAVHSVGAIRKSVQGGAITKETTRKYRDVETGKLVTERTVERAAPDWRAAAWMLERQHPGQFGKAATQMELSGPGGGPVEMSAVAAERLSEKIFANIAAITAGNENDTATAIDTDTDSDDGDVVDAEIVDGD